MPRRLLTLLILAGAPACTDPHTPNDEALCPTEPACVTRYRESLARYNSCMSDRGRAGYAGPGGPQPPVCEPIRNETEQYAAAVKRFRSRKHQESAEEEGGGYEVPPLPAGPAR